MISLLVLVIFIFFAVIFQITFLDFFSIGAVSVEIIPLLVIYAGLRFNAIYAGIFSFLLGLFVDSLISPIGGLYTLIYVFFFYISFISSAKISSDNIVSLSLFTGICFFLQGILIVLFYWLILNENIIKWTVTIFIPQAILMGILSPLLYPLLTRFEVLFYAEDRQPDRRL
jgi:cell shape-determining protein MreD